MISKSRFILSLLLVGIASTSNSQTQFSGWLASFNTIKTGKKTSIHGEMQLRSTDHVKNLQTLILRGGLNYSVRKNMVITAGYGFIHSRRVVNNTVGHAKEHRSWQQFQINHSIKKKLLVAHRFRLEQRFIEKTKVIANELEHDGYAYANRFRYFTRYVLPRSMPLLFSLLLPSSL